MILTACQWSSNSFTYLPKPARIILEGLFLIQVLLPDTGLDAKCGCGLIKMHVLTHTLLSPFTIPFTILFFIIIYIFKHSDPWHGPPYFFSSGDSIPSSNSYTLPNILGTNVPAKKASAAYTMTGRRYTGGFAEDFAKTPGPGTYDMVRPSAYIRKAPAFSMQGRSNITGSELYRYVIVIYLFNICLCFCVYT